MSAPSTDGTNYSCYALMLTSRQDAICALLMQARGHYDTTEALPCACAANSSQLQHCAFSSNSNMPSIVSLGHTCLIGILALSACIEGRELTSTTVTDGASLGAALKRENVEIIKVKGECLLWRGLSRFGASHLCSLVIKHVIGILPI